MTDFNAFAPNYTNYQIALADPLAGLHGPTSKGREGEEGKGMEGEGTGGKGKVWGKKGRGYLFFSLSRPVHPKRNPCTCWMMLRCCPAMAREQILTVNP